MKVLKFGGSSVGTPEAIRSLLRIVSEAKKDNEPMVVVCSAMQGVTRTLSDLIKTAAEGGDVAAELSVIEGRHYDAVRALLEVKRQNHALLGLKLFMNELEEILAGVRALGEASPRTKDRILAYGELLSCFMITHFISQHCGKAVLLIPVTWSSPTAISAKPMLMRNKPICNYRSLSRANPT